MAREEDELNLMTPYKNFLIRGVLPPNEDEGWRLKQKASYYIILDGELFKRGLTIPLLKCLDNQQADYVMRELYEGIYGLHTGRRSLATKVVWAGYYWLALRAYAFDFNKSWRRCQEFPDVPHTHPNNIHNLSSSQPFAMWGMNILEPLSKAQRAVKCLLIVIEYFTKWIETKPLREITASEVEKTTWKYLIYMYSLRYTIVTDNPIQFKAQIYEDFLTRLGIKHLVTSVEHRQTNG